MSQAFILIPWPGIGCRIRARDLGAQLLGANAAASLPGARMQVDTVRLFLHTLSTRQP